MGSSISKKFTEYHCDNSEPVKATIYEQRCHQLVNSETAEPDNSEEVWRNKLLLHDNTHSQLRGLTIQDVNELILNVEHYLPKEPSKSTQEIMLMTCLQASPNNMINCTKEINEFVGAVDTILTTKLNEEFKITRIQQKQNALRQLFEVAT